MDLNLAPASESATPMAPSAVVRSHCCDADLMVRPSSSAASKLPMRLRLPVAERSTLAEISSLPDLTFAVLLDNT